MEIHSTAFTTVNGTVTPAISLPQKFCKKNPFHSILHRSDHSGLLVRLWLAYRTNFYLCCTTRKSIVTKKKTPDVVTISPHTVVALLVLRVHPWFPKSLPWHISKKKNQCAMRNGKNGKNRHTKWEKNPGSTWKGEVKAQAPVLTVKTEDYHGNDFGDSYVLPR